MAEERQGQAQPVVTGQYETVGYRQVSVTAAAQTLATMIGGAGVPLKAKGSAPKVVRILPETGRVRFRDDGTDPTGAVGYLIYSGQEYEYDGDALSALKLIRDSGEAANVTVSLWFLG